jgi:hypothetical protein
MYVTHHIIRCLLARWLRDVKAVRRIERVFRRPSRNELNTTTFAILLSAVAALSYKRRRHRLFLSEKFLSSRAHEFHKSKCFYMPVSALFIAHISRSLLFIKSCCVHKHSKASHCSCWLIISFIVRCQRRCSRLSISSRFSFVTAAEALGWLPTYPKEKSPSSVKSLKTWGPAS